MSDLDFQNGFIVGMATRGITRSGLQYEPLVWNDDGVYSYFYIDFKKPMDGFSTGMLSESIVVHDSEQLVVTGFSKVSASVYKINCNIAGKVSGITVINKATSLLSFSDGKKLPPFAVHFYVAGITPYVRTQYVYESAQFEVNLDVSTEVISNDLWTAIDAGTHSESAEFQGYQGISVIETFSLTLT